MPKIKTNRIFFLLIVWVCAQTINAQDERRFETSKQLDIFNAIVKEVEMFYVDSVEVDKMVRQGVDAMLRGLDPYTEYFPEQDVDKLTSIATGEYGGIGAYIRLRNEGVIITEPFEGMPAQLAGLKAGDLILAIDTIDVSKFSSDRVSELLKGAPNSKLTVTVRRPGEKNTRKFDIIRKQVSLNPITYYGVYGNKTGYICQEGFNEKTAQAVKTAFEDLKQNQQINSLILDLRNNGGGILEAAVQIANLFVPKGQEIVSTRGKINQRDRIYRTSLNPVDTIMPIAILINGISASSSEILAGALQDLDRAVLIGERSFGKGLVQTPRELPYDGMVKITISKYFIPSGRCIQQMDYSHRNPDGTVSAIPDSLTSVFYTSKGRPVRDGGGLRPDFEVEEPKMPTMMYYLSQRSPIADLSLFDYVTEWVQAHPTIPPAEEFVYPDEDYESFKTYLKNKKFTYDRQSERVLKSLKEIAGVEGFLDENQALFDEMEAKLTPDLDRDLERYKDQVKQIISEEIVNRYYFQRGEMIEILKNDPVLEKALRVLEDQELYRMTLSAPKGNETPEKTNLAILERK
ncbi:MAG: S41 family peptidase [Tannerella sp.]|jgi:carboxyl-terminal processing protease|nr:S41 family peptidase [Tannerella sp.]